MLKFALGIVVYYVVRRLVKGWLEANDLAFPPMSTWLIINTFAITLAYIATMAL